MLLLLSTAPELLAQGTPAGTRIPNVARLTYQDEDGPNVTVTSNIDVIVVGQVGGIDLDPPRSLTVDPGASLTLVHTLKNLGNGTDSFTVSAHSRSGWPVRIYQDANGNGVGDSGELLASAPIPLSAGSTASLLLATDVPANATLRGTTDSIRVVGVSLYDPRISDQLIDQLLVRSAGIAVSLNKSVDKVSASVGDTITYTVRYSAVGPNKATNFRLVDPIPSGASYVSGSLKLNGVPLSDSSGDDVGSFDAIENRIVIVLATIAGGESGSVSFQVRVGR